MISVLLFALHGALTPSTVLSNFRHVANFRGTEILSVLHTKLVKQFDELQCLFNIYIIAHILLQIMNSCRIECF